MAERYEEDVGSFCCSIEKHYLHYLSLYYLIQYDMSNPERLDLDFCADAAEALNED